MARKSSSALADLFGIAVMLPWWVGVTLAVILYFIIHSFVAPNEIMPGQTIDVGKQLIHTFASILQYAVPSIFLLGALVSGLKPLYKAAKWKDRSPSAAKVPQAAPSLAVVNRPTDWSIELINSIEWRSFEKLCFSIWEMRGYNPSWTSIGADGGIDFFLCSPKNPEIKIGIVQCKAWQTRQIGVSVVRELLGVRVSEKFEFAALMIAGKASSEARELAEKNEIWILDTENIVQDIRKLSVPTQQKLLSDLLNTDYLTPTCPNCDIKLVKRHGKNGRSFWGCKKFPSCRYILN